MYDNISIPFFITGAIFSLAPFFPGTGICSRGRDDFDTKSIPKKIACAADFSKVLTHLASHCNPLGYVKLQIITDNMSEKGYRKSWIPYHDLNGVPEEAKAKEIRSMRNKAIVTQNSQFEVLALEAINEFDLFLSAADLQYIDKNYPNLRIQGDVNGYIII